MVLQLKTLFILSWYESNDRLRLRGVYQDYLNFYANKLFKEKTFLTGGSVSLRSIEDTI
jgi:hypothetical protein